MKRTFDFLVALLMLAVLLPLLCLIAALVKLSSRGPALFQQERIGRAGRPFFICKFRTMRVDAPQLGDVLTIGDDPRITRVGRFLRQAKLDELPQLVNVLKGDMSLVGPRPQTRKFVEMFPEEYEVLLQIRPGITDLASIKYRNEAEVLGQTANPQEEYIREVLPDKIRLAKQYIRLQSFWFDLNIIFFTVVMLVRDRLWYQRHAAMERPETAAAEAAEGGVHYPIWQQPSVLSSRDT